MPDKFRDNDTIAAIATPIGPGGIGIVRVSGPMAAALFKKVFRPARSVSEPVSHHLYYGWVIDPGTGGAVIDEALVTLMYAPHSYTAEDVLEIQCHSGPAVLSRILQVCISQGARLAEPGEFTKRAFLNGRIDLSQAEAVLDLTTAGADAARGAAVEHLQGGLSSRVHSVRQVLRDVLAAVEVAIDYPEEDVEIFDEFHLEEKLATEALPVIQELIRSYERAAPYREGMDVLIVGRPNVGKSSLLNTLCCEERAIVTPIPGTTRDMVEGQIRLRGMLVRLTDTAGIRKDPDPVEAVGIDRIGDRVSSAHLALWVLDVSQPLTPEDIQAFEMVRSLASRNRLIAVLNKTDKLPSPVETARELYIQVREKTGLDVNWVAISAKTGHGMESLMGLMAKRLLGEGMLEPPVCMPNLRQKTCLSLAQEAIQKAIKALRAGLSPELTAVDLKSALDSLGEITGETVTEDILDHIFSNFCLGK